MNETKCATAQTPQLQLRESVDVLADIHDKANSLAESIEDKLYGVNPSVPCDKNCPPNNVQNGISRSTNAIKKLHSRLDDINSRL